MLNWIGSDRNRRATLKTLDTVGLVLAVSTLIVLLMAWGGLLLWLGVQGSRALAHLI